MSTIIHDSRVSWKAKGLFLWLASNGETGILDEAEIIRASRDGRSAVRAALNELEHHGYLTRAQERNDDGRLGASHYMLTDNGGDQ